MVLLTAEVVNTTNSVGAAIEKWGFPTFAMVVLAILIVVLVKYGIKRIEAYEQRSVQRSEELERKLGMQEERFNEERKDALLHRSKLEDTLADIARQQQQTIAENTAVIGKATEQLGRSSAVIDKALDNQEKLTQHLEQFAAQDNQLMALMQQLIEKVDR